MPRKPRKPSRPSKRRIQAPVVGSPPRVEALADLQELQSAQTVIYVHGIGNKPAASVLKCQWDTALFGAPIGDRSRMAYWVNRRRYAVPLPDTCGSGDLVAPPELGAGALGTRAAAAAAREPLDVEALSSRPEQRRLLRSLAERMLAAGEAAPGGVAAKDVEAKLLPLPGFLRKIITRGLTRLFLEDVNDFFFDEAVRSAMEDRLRERLDAGGGPFVVIGHSQGSMIAYEVLRQLAHQRYDVRLFVTIGSPLGLDEVQDVLRGWVGGDTLPVPRCVHRWVNVADPWDPVALDPELRSEYTPASFIEDQPQSNLDSPRHPHSGTGYLRTAAVRNAVRAVLGNDFAQHVARFVVARDLANNLEDSQPEDRHEVLIQLADPDGGGSLDTAREKTLAALKGILLWHEEVAQIEPLKRFVAARLTRSEVEQLRARHQDLRISTIWRDAAKRALISVSTHTVQARPANLGYGSTGRGIRWAVLDTGIRADHPHFARHKNVVQMWDCTKRGDPVQVAATSGDKPFDTHGHGTHVAGIIAGEQTVRDAKTGAQTALNGMGPETQLLGYRVLDGQGNGQDSWIIKALDHIGDQNEHSGELFVHGVNLSLGGGFDPSVYGCGHSPLCRELRRLWRQGVLVVLAAGNEGYAVLQTTEGEFEANMDLSIGDPANLEESIAVGSVHKANPHTYGISYFSSRGPTADGRRKPDVVAPGERILSASHHFTPRSDLLADLYVEMSGTSMAAPHVSGILAAFLSLRREFIGYPDRVKSILLGNCTDLARDPYIQGAGLPNLTKMLLNS